VFIFGCASELVYVKDAKLYKVKDDGDDQEQIIPQPPPTTGHKFHRSDVNHQGDKVAFTSNDFDVGGVGTIWIMKIDGSSAKQINLADSNSVMAKWRPDNERFIAYYGKDTAGGFGICIVRTDIGTPENGQKICDTSVWDYDGFDLNKPPSVPLQIIFSHYEFNLDNSYKLYRRQVEFVPGCTGGRVLINPYPPIGVDPKDLDETRPVISFSQEMLASAVKWPSVMGIRIRGIGQDGSIGVPLTFQLQGIQMITGVSFAENDKKVYLSAKTTAGDHNLYSIGLKEILEGFSDLVSVPPAQIPQPIPVTPKKIQVGSGKNISPSGINDP